MSSLERNRYLMSVGGAQPPLECPGLLFFQPSMGLVLWAATKLA